MNENIYVIADVHGHYNELIALINKLPEKFNSKICFVGDLIDRGPDSKKVVDLIKDRKYDCVLGNHELMCMEADGNPFNMNGGYNQSLYNHYGINGGVKTLDSYGDLELLKKDFDFFKKLPLYIKYNVKDERGRVLIVSHSSISNYITDDFKFNHKYAEDVLWNRSIINGKIRESETFFNVFGHTILPKPVIRRSYAAIETGIAGSNSGNGKLTCIEFPSKRIITN